MRHASSPNHSLLLRLSYRTPNTIKAFLLEYTKQRFCRGKRRPERRKCPQGQNETGNVCRGRHSIFFHVKPILSSDAQQRTTKATKVVISEDHADGGSSECLSLLRCSAHSLTTRYYWPSLTPPCGIVLGGKEQSSWKNGEKPPRHKMQGGGKILDAIVLLQYKLLFRAAGMLQAPIPIDGSQESDFQGIATTCMVRARMHIVIVCRYVCMYVCRYSQQEQQEQQSSSSSSSCKYASEIGRREII